MPKWHVRVSRTEEFLLTVEADNEEDAETNAIDQMIDSSDQDLAHDFLRTVERKVLNVETV